MMTSNLAGKKLDKAEREKEGGKIEGEEGRKEVTYLRPGGITFRSPGLYRERDPSELWQYCSRDKR